MTNFVCPMCEGEDGTWVKDSRPNRERQYIRRRRVCNSCDHVFSTYEQLAPEIDRHQLRTILKSLADAREAIESAETLVEQSREFMEKYKLRRGGNLKSLSS